jgi:peptidylprolyl isomerase
VRRTLQLVIVLGLGLSLVACSSSETPEPVASETGGILSPAPVGSVQIPEVSGDLNAQPTIQTPQGNPPDQLVIKDLTEGSGDVVTPESVIEAHYVGMSWSNGQLFDASWPRGETLTIPLNNLILGWQEGLLGMKVGGRRLLLIPPALGYPNGSGSIAPGETLVFVVDLVGVQ